MISKGMIEIQVEEENDGSSVIPTKQRMETRYAVPVSSFDEIGSSDVEGCGNVVNSIYSGLPCYENTRRERGNAAGMVKSSRRRVPGIPAGFIDSVSDSLKSEKLDRRSEDDLKNGMCDKKRRMSQSSYNGGDFVKKQRVLEKLGLRESWDEQLNSSSKKSVTSLLDSAGHPDTAFLNGTKSAGAKLATEVVQKDYYRAQDFSRGDLVWAKCSKRSAAWPAIIIDPMREAPQCVLNACVPKTICVMFYGYNKKRKRDYGWIKDGMIYPFAEYMDRFQTQTQLFGSKPSEFCAAIEEALLVENGHTDSVFEVGHESDPVPDHSTIRDANGSNREMDYCSSTKDTKQCDSCDMIHPCKKMKKVKGRTSDIKYICDHCAKLHKSKQYCGICKKIWHHSDGGNWVCCDGCDVWVHAECASFSGKLFKDVKDTDYYCPECKAMSNHEPFSSQTLPSKARFIKKKDETVVPDKIIVVCNGVDGIYYPALHLVECMCGSCGERKQKLTEWERHTGSRAKKWKTSVKVKSSMLPLEQWMSQYNLLDIIPLKLNKEQLCKILQEKYEPVCPKWTTECCAVCGWVEDWDDNKMVICNRCQIAIHQECYGVTSDQDFTSWVCRACESPDAERECCLCPIKGGALKPTEVDTLWVHVTCAWFRPEVGFPNFEKMEPAVGLFKIPLDPFLKACVICKQVHGSCTQCFKCATYFHSMCALRAGYHMELQSSEKWGQQMTKLVSYCAVHGVPDAANGIVIRTPTGIFGAKNLLNQSQRFQGSRLVSCKTNELPSLLTAEVNEHEPFSSARCRIYKRLHNQIDYEAELIGEVEKFSTNVLERLAIHKRFLEIVPSELSVLLRQKGSNTVLELYRERMNLLNEMHTHIIRSYQSITTAYQSITTALKILLDGKSCSDKGKEDRIRNLLNKMSGACLATKMTEEFQSMGKKLNDNYGCEKGGGGSDGTRRSKVDVAGPSSTTTSATKMHILYEHLGPKEMKLFKEMPQWNQWKNPSGNIERFLKPIKKKDKDFIDQNCFENQLLGLKGISLDWISIKSLRPGCDLEDDVINHYLDLLQMREIEVRGYSKQILYNFDTFFYNLGQSSLDQIELGRTPQVSDWLKFYLNHSSDRTGATFSGADYAIFPVCNDKGEGGHYLLLVFDISNWSLIIMEPFPNDFLEFQESAGKFVTTALNHMVYLRAPDRFKATAPICYVPQNIPKQKNYHDCGVAVCMYSNAFTQGLDVANMQWTQAQFDNFRYRMVKELVIKKRCRNMCSKKRIEDANEDGLDGAKKDEARKDGDSL